jgi:hypothetical protein
MAIAVVSGASTDQLTVDPTSKAARVTLYDSAGREVSAQVKKTYMASNTFTPVATPTDLVIIEGSATKTVRILAFYIATTNTAAGSQAFSLVKRSTADTTGTFVAATAVALDSTNPAASVNRVGHFTANPGALGTTVGTIVTKRVASPAAIPASFAGVVQDAGYDLLATAQNSNVDQCVTLRGVTECLALNFAGAALVAGQTHAYFVLWIEE